MCGSFCTHARALEALRPLAKDNYITPVLSEIVQTTDTRFGSANSLYLSVVNITGNEPMPLSFRPAPATRSESSPPA